MIIKILSKLSYIIPSFIIIVSRRAKKIYQTEGYDNKKFKFVPNGFDLSFLKINKVQKKIFLRKIKIKKKIPIIGNVARYDPQKDHLNLLNALSLIRLKNIDFFCVLIGTNMSQDNLKLVTEIKKLGLSKYIKLLGKKGNITEIMNGLDIHILSSSYGEGFPNVLAEAMACGTPCVSTDVGDSAFIVGKTGWVVPPKNSVKLSKAIENALNEIRTGKWNKKCTMARQKIKKKFTINKMLNSYNKVWIKVYKKSKKNI